MLDTSVLIRSERRGTPIDLTRFAADEHVFISVITASELLMGVHRADNDTRRKRRSDFVEAVLAGVGVLDFTLADARRHAMVRAELARQGLMIGAHDIMIAATALHHGLSLVTENAAEFSRVPGLIVVPS
jgi:predicted nucleic acid-binding protein